MERRKIELPNADLLYIPNFLNLKEAAESFQSVLENTNWKQKPIKLFGKKYMQPRLIAFFSEDEKTYSYSGISMAPSAFSPELKKIKQKLEATTGETFNACLANLYRDGQDSMGWHSDDERELGKDPVIASVSLGAERVFHLRHKNDKSLKFKLELENGSLFLMKGTTQQYWKHQLPKTSKKVGKRINLTFRNIL